MSVKQLLFKDPDQERLWIIQDIIQLLNQGTDPSTIAIIARKHADLLNLMSLCLQHHIPVTYEKSRNVLEQSHIVQILTILEYIHYQYDQFNSKPELLPVILSFPFWEIDAEILWYVSIKAYANKKTWGETIMNYELFFDLSVISANELAKLKNIFVFLINLSKEAQSKSAFEIIDIITGSVSKTDQSVFVSPFRSYYVTSPLLAELKGERVYEHYADFVSSLKVFMTTLQNHGSLNGHVLVKDILKIIELYKHQRIAIQDTSRTGSNGVSLITAHKSKGMEWDRVYVPHCVKQKWFNKGLSSKLNFQANLPLQPEKDITDDRLRLLFVAITRAENTLILSASEENESGKQLEIISYLPESWEKLEIDVHTTPKTITHEPIKFNSSIINELADRMESYALSVTHLQNYLDVSRGGPRMFVEQNLLRFPSSMSPESIFGTVFHSCHEFIIHTQNSTQRYPDVPEVMEHFKLSLDSHVLSADTKHMLMAQGERYIPDYVRLYQPLIFSGSEAEYSFKHQHITINDIEVTGNLDRVYRDDNGMLLDIIDLKTSAAKESWNKYSPTDEYSSITKWKYELQLSFYIILAKHSTELSKYTIRTCAVEFVKVTNKPIQLAYIPNTETIDKIEKLITIVGGKIKDYDFPDTSHYQPNAQGINQFINDLLTYQI